MIWFFNRSLILVKSFFIFRKFLTLSFFFRNLYFSVVLNILCCFIYFLFIVLFFLQFEYTPCTSHFTLRALSWSTSIKLSYDYRTVGLQNSLLQNGAVVQSGWSGTWLPIVRKRGLRRPTETCIWIAPRTGVCFHIRWGNGRDAYACVWMGVHITDPYLRGPSGTCADLTEDGSARPSGLRVFLEKTFFKLKRRKL